MTITRTLQWLIASLLLLTSSSLFATPVTIDLLLVAYDQGESNAFRQMEDNLKRKSINYRILSLGRASEIFKDHPQNITPELKSPQELRNNRELKLSWVELNELSSQLNPSIVYSGMASASQAQILNHFGKLGSRTIAFYDNFDPVGEKEFVQPFLREADEVDEFHIPSIATKNSFNSLPQARESELIVTGQPALESWDDIYRRTDVSTVRTQLGLSPQQPIVVFAGGYDDTYEKYFEVFIRATQQMPSITFLVTYHPKTDGSLERSIIDKFAARNVRLIEKGAQTTAVLSKAAVAVLTHKSSIGVQALYKGKPVLFVAEPDLENFLIQKNLALVASSPEEVKQKLMTTLTTHQQFLSLDALGMPKKPSQFIARHLKELLDNQK